MPAPPLIVRKEKVVETTKTETELNVARILQNHLKEELKTPKTGEITQPPPKAEKSGVDKDVEKTVTIDEDVIPVAAEVTIEADEIEANVEHQTNVIEIPSDIHEPPSHSHETRPNSETTETDSHPNDSSSSTTTEEQPNRNKRVRSRTSRYIEFVVEEDEIVEEPVSKKNRKRKSILDQSPKNANLDDEYVPARRSKSGTRLPTTDEPCDPKIDYDCKIEGVEKIFDNVLEELLIEKIALTNACEIANTAIMAKSEKLKNECQKYIFENLRNNATLRNYVALNKEMKDEICAELAAKHNE
uniref:Uncharacterized protein n=1 Tax=Panagrolaimus superbus TaxID=310955 RepID=A0A914Z418_9BILA